MDDVGRGLIALSERSASHGRMKNLHIPTILVTLGLVGLVAILSGQNMVGTPRVVVHNPLGVPGWVPSDVWMASFESKSGTTTYQDYTVPAGHFALVRSASGFIGWAGVEPDGSVSVDDGSGFSALTGWDIAGGDFDPGIVVDEGSVIRVSMTTGSTKTTVATVHGYLIPK